MYGVIIAFGLMLATVYCMRRAPKFGLTEDHVLDGVLWVTPFAFLCARAYYCAFAWEMYADNPISVLYIWQGGIAIYGGVLGAVAGIIVFCKIKKISLGATLDLVLLGFLIGQSIGRWGNFFNREAFGAETDSFLRMGLYDTISGKVVYHHPTFLYESLWNALGFVILHFLSKKREYDGQIALGYAAWYGLGRFFIEGLRTDSLYLPGTELRVSQLLAAVSFFAAAAVLVWFMLKPPAKPLFADRVKDTDKGGNEDA
jgi:phosphatidylglycerol:prolipoprotein diacylglycerol transferase